jgi:beta-lactamase regulating signal transducer with metallopeptidase domain
MIVPYLLRLLCLCLAAFFVIHTAAGLAVSLAAPAVVRVAERMRARRGAALLLTLRLLPATVALTLVGGLCIPSYLLLEQEGSAERVGTQCLAAAMLAASLWAVAILRSIRAAALSARHERAWAQVGSKSRLEGAQHPVWIVDAPGPLLALAGVLRPQLVISRAAAAGLSSKQLQAALLHEEAHRAAHDNLKRLLLLLSPGLLPGWHGFQALERGWFRLTEWAADDAAVAGNPRLSLSLASALVRMARIGGTPELAPLAVSFLADGGDLSTRVDRLLKPAKPAPASRRRPMLAVAMALAAVFVAATLQPETLESAHWLLEQLVR